MFDCFYSCGTAGMPHMFFAYLFCILQPCLFYYFPPFLFIPAHLSHPLPPLLCPFPPQTWLTTCRWTTSPSRSSCWPLAWPRLGWAESPQQPLSRWDAGCPPSPWCCFCCYCFVNTDSCIAPPPTPTILPALATLFFLPLKEKATRPALCSQLSFSLE